MNIYPIKHLPQKSQAYKQTTLVHAAEPRDFAFLLVFFTLMLQGLFFNQMTLWVVERRYIIFNLLPFNLYPSDLFLLPGLLILALFSKDWRRERSSNQRSGYLIPVFVLIVWGVGLLLGRRIGASQPELLRIPADFAGLFLLIPLLLVATKVWRLHSAPVARRQMLLLLWWTICLFGVLNGVLNQTPNLTGDFRELALRSLLAVAMFYLGQRVNLVWISNKLINIGVLFAFVFGVVGIARLTGVALGSIFLGAAGVHATLPLLLPYSLALSRALSAKPGSLSLWLYPLLIAVGIMLTVSKPTIGGLVLCTVMTIFIVRQTVFSSLRSVVIFLTLTAVMVVTLLWLFDTTADAEQIVRTAYLKEDYAVQDLSGSRFTIWEMGIDAWLQNPVFGYGFGYLLSGETINIGTGSLVYQSIIWPHNILVQLLMQTGLVGTAIFGICVVGWFIQTRRDARILSGQIKWIHASFVAIPLTVGFMALYGQFLGHVHGSFLLWACLGLETAIVHQVYSQNESDWKIDG